MKKLLSVLITLLVLAPVIQAAENYVASETTGTNRAVSATGRLYMKYLTVVPNGTNAIIRLYDYPYTTLVRTNSAYTNYTMISSNVVTTFVGPTGITNAFTNTVLTPVVAVTAATTNTAVTPLAIYAVPADIPTTFTDTLLFNTGVILSNDSSAVIIMNYDSM